MNEPAAVTFGASSHVGLVREVNEDSLLTDPPLFAVADGMGGHDGGDLASQTVIEELGRVPLTAYSAASGAQKILDAFRSTQQRLLAYGATHRGSDGRRWRGGTTAVVALLVEHEGTPHWLLANLGDSRIYTFDADDGDGRLDRVSTDHSVVQELIDTGMITEEEALVHPERHIVTRALGGPEDVAPDFFVLPVAETPAGAALLRRHQRHGARPGDRGRAGRPPRPGRRRRRSGRGRARSRWRRQRDGGGHRRDVGRRAVSPVSRSVVPGEWYAVLGDDMVVLLPPAAKDRVSAIWERVDEGAGFDEVLDTLISRGLRDLPAFVLVSQGVDGSVKVVVRGAGRAELTTDDGPVVVEGSAETTWVERSLTGVTGLHVEVADASGEPYAVGPGLVRVAEVREPVEAPPAPVEHADPQPEPAPTLPPPIAPEVETVDVETGAFEPVAFAPPGPGVVPLVPVPPPLPPPRLRHRLRHRLRRPHRPPLADRWPGSCCPVDRSSTSTGS